MTRVCATCPTRLSRYNEGDLCGACVIKERTRLLEATAAAERRRAAKVARLEEIAAETGSPQAPAEGTIRARILDALPGTMPEVAAAVDKPNRLVSKYLATLMNNGLVTATGPRGGGVARRVYLPATRDEEAA